MVIAYIIVGALAGLLSLAFALLSGASIGQALALYPIVGIATVLCLAIVVVMQRGARRIATGATAKPETKAHRTPLKARMATVGDTGR